MNGRYKAATIEDVFQWFMSGVFRLEGDEVFKGNRKLVPTINKRNRCQYGDKRIHLYHGGKRRSVNLSAIVWMVGNNRPLPKGFQIHHRNGDYDDNRFENLFALTEADHSKLHNRPLIQSDFDDVPF